MSDTLSPSRRSKRVRSGSAGDGSEASRSPPRAIRSPEQKRNKNGIHLAPTFESDPQKIQSRLKQIGFGKNTVGYDNYLAAVARNERRSYAEHPRTPDPYEIQSKRSFDGRIKAWRRELHKWDLLQPPPPIDSSLLTAIGANESLEQSLARLAHERYTEGLLAISELAAATTAARAEAKIAAVDDQFEEYLQNRQHQQGQEQEQEQEQSSHHQQLDSMEVDENIHKNGDNDNDNNDDEDIL